MSKIKMPQGSQSLTCEISHMPASQVLVNLHKFLQIAGIQADDMIEVICMTKQITILKKTRKGK